MTDNIPLYLGVPVIHRSDYADYYVFDKISVVEHYKIVPLKVDYYELYAILENGERVGIRAKDLSQFIFDEDLIQKAIKTRFPNADDCYKDWLKLLVPENSPKPSPDHFLIIIHQIPGMNAIKTPNKLGDRYWCPRWPTECEIQSMISKLERFELCIYKSDS